MGLKNKLALGEWVRTNQRELDYGDNAPLIPQKRLPAVGELSETNLATSLDNLTDGFVPGGLLTGGERAITDTARISKFLVTGEGISFLGKQAALQRANPESLVSPRNRQWTPANLLAQIPSNLAGLHFRRDGLIDKDFESNFNYSPENGGLKYEQVFKDIILTDTEGTYDSTLKGLFTNLQLGQDPSIIKEYSGGANSIFGIGTTTIKKYGNVERLENDLKAYNSDSYEYTEKVRARFTGPYPMSEYNIGDPGKEPGKARKGTDYETNVLNNGIDALNAEDIINRNNLTIYNSDINDKDYINFRIALIDTQEPLIDEVLMFRAFLESVSDNYTGNWNSYEYNGRAEKFHVYSGFDRDIGFDFKIAAQSKAELRPLWYKLNYLVGSTAPEYVNRRMRGRYVRLTIGDWMYEIPGFFPSINLSWESRFPWELDETQNTHMPQKGVETDNEDNILGSQHPMILNVRCQFKPIHDFTPESRKDKPFIIRVKGTKQGTQTPETEGGFNATTDLNIQ